MTANWKILFNPYTRIAGWGGAALGAVITVAVAAIGWLSHTIFPGVVDAKIPGVVEWWSLGNCLLAIGIGVIVTAAFLYLAGLLFSRATRPQDIFATVTLARVPFIISALVGFAIDPADMDSIMQTLNSQVAAGEIPDLSLTAPMIVGSLIILLMSIWSVVMLYNGFKVSTGSKGMKTGWMFAGAIIAAEIVSLVITHEII